MYCNQCGVLHVDDAIYCKNCGVHLQDERETEYYNAIPERDSVNLEKEVYSTEKRGMENKAATRSNLIEDPVYKPISMWGYFGYQLLFAIPLIGFVIALVFAFGGTQNINLKNFARSTFCILIIAVLLFFSIMVFGSGLAFWAAL